MVAQLQFDTQNLLFFAAIDRQHLMRFEVLNGNREVIVQLVHFFRIFRVFRFGDDQLASLHAAPTERLAYACKLAS